MRIGTWNVEYADPVRREAHNEILGAHPADIWVLTETHDDLVPPGCGDPVHSDCRPRNQQRHTNLQRVRERSRWVSIWSSFEMKPIFVEERADRCRTAVAEVNLGDRGKVLVYGTVLPWYKDKGKSGLREKWSEQERVIPEQLSEWRELRASYPDAALCVVGDFNTHMGAGARKGSRQGIASLKAGLAECGLFCATASEHLSSAWLEQPPIDHIVLPLEWQERTSVVAAWPARRLVSDHSGMIVEVRDQTER